MDTKEAAKLKVGDRLLIWADTEHACSGVVIETGYNAVKTRWDDGQIGVLHMDDHVSVSRYSGTIPIIPRQESPPSVCEPCLESAADRQAERAMEG